MAETASDPEALSAEQQEKLAEMKIQTRIADEVYLRSHPEIRILFTDFLETVLQQKPEDVKELAAAYFTEETLIDRILTKTRELRDNPPSSDMS